MRRILLLVLAAALSTTFTSAQNASTQKTILRLESTLNHAWDTHDTTTAARLIAGDYRGVSSSGHPLVKADILRAIATNDEGSTDVSDEQVRLSGQIAIYTALITDHLKKPDGTQSLLRTRVTDIWEHRHNGWVLIASQETFVKD